MKQNKGITLISLVVYIIGMVVIISIVGSLLSFYNNNMVKMNDTSDVNMELSKFSARMIAETKEAGNEIAEITGSTIRFKNGNVYTYQDNRIYENTMVVSQYVKDYLASLEVDGSKQILRIHIILQKGETEITNNLTYVIEETKGQVAMGPTYIINNAGDITVKAENESITITEGDSNNIEQYFTYTTNGNLPPTSIKYIDTSNNDVEITNTNSLEIGAHTIKCTITNAKGDSVSTTMTIVVEMNPGVFGNLYRISDTEYHLIFNRDGDIAKGYTEAQLVARGTNIINGSGTVKLSEDDERDVSDQPWGPYSSNITKVKIEELIKPNSTKMYFYSLSQIAQIENIENIDTSNVIEMDHMFQYCGNLTSLDLSGFNTKNVKSFKNMFLHCKKLESVNLSGFNTSNATDMYGMFNNCNSLNSLELSDFDTSNVTNMMQMFFKCNSLTSLEINHFDTSKVSNMESMFYNCTSLKNLELNNWNTNNVTTMTHMFYGCSSLTSLELSNWNTSNVTDMSLTFRFCSSLTSLELSNWNTSQVTTMYQMFHTCSQLTTIYVGNKWSTASVTNGAEMFGGCTALKGAISYDSTKRDATYANYTTGYLTYKAPTTT